MIDKKFVGLDARRRKLHFRSWHRGMREMDLIFGLYADHHIGILSETHIDEYEKLLEISDHDCFKWITKEASTPQQYNTPLFQSIIAFHQRTKF